MFTTLVLIIHVIVCIALILIILLQSGKGADIGAVFGGGSSQTVFGSTRSFNFFEQGDDRRGCGVYDDVHHSDIFFRKGWSGRRAFHCDGTTSNSGPDDGACSRP